ncbi:hypothetical protein D3C85_1081390 [compost metagenome]
MAITTCSSPGPSAATNASASTRLGNEIKISVTRISTASTLPPKYPAVTPSSNPKGPTVTDTSSTIYSVMREPYTRRLKISRPNSSVPNQCRAFGATSALLRSCTSGLYGAISGAKAATISSSRTIPPPIAVSGLRAILPTKPAPRFRLRLIRWRLSRLAAPSGVSRETVMISSSGQRVDTACRRAG